MIGRSFVFAAAASALIGTVGVAQTSCSVAGQTGKCSPDVVLSTPGTMTNPALLTLTVSPTSSPLTPLAVTATMSDMDVAAGVATPTPVSFTVQGNRAWSVQISGAAAKWTASAGAWTNKPVSDLRWSLSSTGATTAMSITPASVTSGSATAGSAATTVYLRPAVHWTTDLPGTYTIGVTFTLTAP
jgi:hypothetical protein